MNYAPWLLWLIPLMAAPLAPLVSMLRQRAADWFTVAVAAITAAVGIYQAAVFTSPYTETVSTWIAQLNLPLQVDVDGIAVLTGAFVALVAFLIVLYSVGYMRHEGGKARYNFLVLLFIGGMLGLVMAGNLIQFYFFWEIVGICSALLIAFYYTRPEARRGGMKAFLMTRVGDASLLVSILIIYSTIHTTSFASIFASAGTAALGGGTLVVVGILMTVGAMGKSAQVPLHTWLPDAMEAPTPVTALIHAATMVNAGVYLLVRMYPLLHISSAVMDTVLVIGLLTALVGGLCAMAENDFKRIFAYSTISQLGFMFAAVGLGLPYIALYLLIGHGFFKALIFLSAGSVVEAVGTRDISLMGGLAGKMKYTYSVFLVSILAMGGLPPLVGFWSKGAMTEQAAAHSSLVFMSVLVISVLTSIYGFRALFKVFHGESRSGLSAREAPAIMLVPMILLCLFVVTAWLPLNYQNILPLYSGSASWLITAAEEGAILATGLLIAYLAFMRYAAETAEIAVRGGVGAARGVALTGMGFDTLYNGLQKRVLRAGGAATAVQSGSFGMNMVLLIAVFALIVLLAGLGVL